MNNIIKYRPYKVADLTSILEIYNYHINNGLANFEENSMTYKELSTLTDEILSLKLPFIVCEYNSQILGFAYLYKFRNKSGYKFSFENSIYIDKSHTNKGVGTNLLKQLLESAKNNNNIKTIVAVIGNDNSEASIKIHKKNGFDMIGVLKKIGFKNNIWLDAIFMQKILNEKN